MHLRGKWGGGARGCHDAPLRGMLGCRVLHNKLSYHLRGKRCKSSHCDLQTVRQHCRMHCGCPGARHGNRPFVWREVSAFRVQQLFSTDDTEVSTSNGCSRMQQPAEEEADKKCLSQRVRVLHKLGTGNEHVRLDDVAKTPVEFCQTHGLRRPTEQTQCSINDRKHVDRNEHCDAPTPTYHASTCPARTPPAHLETTLSWMRPAQTTLSLALA